MAIEDYLNFFGGTPTLYQGLLTDPKDRIALERRANIGGLLSAAGALAQGMSPQGYRRSPLQNVLTALGAGFAGAGQTYESGINQMANVQKLQQSQRDLARQQQARDAVEAVIKTREVANNPALVAYFRANPDKALERFVNIQEAQAARGISPAITPSAAPVSKYTTPAETDAEAWRRLEESAATPSESERLPSTEVTGSRYQKQLKEAEAAYAFYSGQGNEVKAKAAREEIADLQDKMRQEQLALSVPKSLKGVHPMLQGMVDSLTENAGDMSRTEIQAAIASIREKDATFRLNSETELRKEFAGLTPVKEFPTVQTAYKQITNALNNPSAANDLAAATKFMKLLDPGSVVRESELGMAMAATGAVERMQNYLTRLQNGEMLNPAQRADFKKAAGLAYQAAESTYNDISNQYIDLAKTNNLNPNNVVLPQRRSVEPKVQSERPTGVGKDWRLSQDAQGNRAWVSPDGTKFVEVK
jgi:hypothetical protein